MQKRKLSKDDSSVFRLWHFRLCGASVIASSCILDSFVYKWGRVSPCRKRFYFANFPRNIFSFSLFPRLDYKHSLNSISKYLKIRPFREIHPPSALLTVRKQSACSSPIHPVFPLSLFIHCKPVYLLI